MKNQRIKILYFLVILFAFFQPDASTQPYYFRHYQVENGLSNNTVYFIRQDSKGFMWFATKDGLNRFDGTQFKVFRVHTSEDEKHLRTDYIYCILPGKEGALWVGAQRGLYLFDPIKEQTSNLSSLVEMFLLRPSSAHAGWPDLSKLTPALAPLVAIDHTGPAAAARQSGALGLDRVAGCFIARGIRSPCPAC